MVLEEGQINWKIDIFKDSKRYSQGQDWQHSFFTSSHFTPKCVTFLSKVFLVSCLSAMTGASFHSTIKEGRGQGEYFLRYLGKIGRREREWRKKVKEDVCRIWKHLPEGELWAMTREKHRRQRVCEYPGLEWQGGHIGHYVTAISWAIFLGQVGLRTSETGESTK